MNNWTVIYNLITNHSISPVPTHTFNFYNNITIHAFDILKSNSMTGPYYHVFKNICVYAELTEFISIYALNRSPFADVSKTIIYSIYLYNFVYLNKEDPNVRIANLNQSQFYEHYYTNECFYFEVLGEFVPEANSFFY
jgi:hypothetical protein